jgi:2-polyprenyl-3-methyl-5-hydroxy-6-metoxy-1,4-benzoquinol methylase
MNAPDTDHFYFNGAHYDALTPLEDIHFWIHQAQTYGDPILELAVGTGRIAIPLAKEGFKVTGIDMSDSMLEHAKRKQLAEHVSVNLLKADIRDFHLHTKFPLIIIPSNSIVHLQALEDLEACLACVKEHLTPNGKLIIDTHNPQFKYLNNDPNKPPSTRTYPNPKGEGMVTVTSQFLYNNEKQINTITMAHQLPDGTEEITDVIHARLHFPQELNALMKYNGFTVDHKMGDYNEEKFHSNSSKQILVLHATSSDPT